MQIFYSDYAKRTFGWDKDWLEKPRYNDVLRSVLHISPESETETLKIRDEVKKGLRPEKDLKKQPQNLGSSYEALNMRIMRHLLSQYIKLNVE